MSKVTSKLQVTLPKAIADRYGVAPGAELIFEPAGDSIRVLVAREPGLTSTYGLHPDDRRALFEAATRRQTLRNRRYRLGSSAVKRNAAGRASASALVPASIDHERGWTRERLYDRDRPR